MPYEGSRVDFEDIRVFLRGVEKVEVSSMSETGGISGRIYCYPLNVPVHTSEENLLSLRREESRIIFSMLTSDDRTRSIFSLFS